LTGSKNRGQGPGVRGRGCAAARFARRTGGETASATNRRFFIPFCGAERPKLTDDKKRSSVLQHSGGFAQFDFDVHRAAAAKDGEVQHIAAPFAVHDFLQGIAGGDGLTFHRHDEVAADG